MGKLSEISAEWGDYDDDADLDILISGIDSNNIPVTKIIRNDGNNLFVEGNVNLIAYRQAETCWSDIDNDGDLDILISGWDINSNLLVTVIYRNDGGDVFEIVEGHGLKGLRRSKSDFGDFDNDGDLDLVMSGLSSSQNPVINLYRNQGQLRFREIETDIPGIAQGEVQLEDFDQDQDLDLLISGKDFSLNPTTSIYENNGSGLFIESTELLPMIYDAISFSVGDYDNDRDMDLLATNTLFYHRPRILEYKQNGFEEKTISLLDEYSESTVIWWDYNNDGRLDIYVTGLRLNGGVSNRLLRNIGDLSFVEEINSGLPAVSECSLDLGDYDNDGDLDLLITGKGTDGRFAELHRNNCGYVNTPPSPPVLTNSKILNGDAVLTWTRSNDSLTGGKGLSYNVLLVPKGNMNLELKSPMAEMETGFRKIVDFGNASFDTSMLIADLDTGTYYWKVQSIDNCFNGSLFSEMDSFRILPPFSGNSSLSTLDKSDK